MRGGSSELLLDPQVELRKRKLLELAHPKKSKEPRRTCRERAWFYATSVFAMTAVSAGSSLLFLVPLYVDPAISTLVADFISRPVTCTTSRREDLSGIFNCTWSSCREGCTSDMYRCSHIYVTYTERGDNASGTTATPATPATVVDAVLLVNIKGCGYPPDVDCANFSAEYGTEGAEFPCYYSRENRTVVMTKYDRDSQVEVIINYFAIPFVITVVTSVVLCVMHCDCRCTPQAPPHHHPPRTFRRSRVEDASDGSISTRVDRMTSQADLTRPL